MHKSAMGVSICGAAGLMSYAVRGRSSTLFGPSVHRGVSTRRAIALTFDDGPSESTPRLLELLERHRAQATFFQCGANVRRLPRVALAVRDAGHEIGNHSDTHPLFCFERPRAVFDDFRRAQNTISEILRVTPKLLRAPFGARWFGFREAQRRLNLLGVMWTVIGRDWTLAADRIAARVLRAAAPGAIVCLHDGRVLESRPDVSRTLDAVRAILPALLARGYHFETVSQILCPTNSSTEC